MANKTRKQRGIMTIPELRQAFDHMELFTAKLIAKGGDAKERRKAFQAEWMRVFHRPVDDKAADAYLAFESKKHKKSGTRKMRGGSAAPLGGAPLDYATRPGLPGVYGVFPAYVTSGFDIYDKVNQDSLTATCGQDITPKIADDMGSNRVHNGGKRRGTRRMTGKKSQRKSSRKTRVRRRQMGGFPTLAEFAQGLSFRPFSTSTPTTSFYDGTMAFKGVPLPPPATAASGNPPYIPYKPTTLDATATDINRDLVNEMRS
jgi:hypothetical protein